VIASAEIYDPVTGQWRSTGSLNQARTQQQAVLLKDGRVLIAGGINGGDALSSAELYDPATESWSTTGNMTEARISFTLRLLNNGQGLAVGGYNFEFSCDAQRSAELYDPATGTWRATAGPAEARSGHAAAELSNGRVAVSGGANCAYNSTKSVELYDAN